MEYFYGKHASLDNRCFIFDNKLINVSPQVEGEYALPDGITSMGYFCITYPQKPVVYVIPDSVTELHEDGIMTGGNRVEGFKGKFAGADGLSLIKDNVLYAIAPNGVTRYEIPEGVTSIAYRVFNTIDTLAELVIPSTCKEIRGKFVDNCPNLKTVYCKERTPPAYTSSHEIFFDMDAANIYVPLLHVAAYKTADGWKNYADKIEGTIF